MRWAMWVLVCIACGEADAPPPIKARTPSADTPKATKPKPTFATEAIGSTDKLLPPVQRMLDPTGFEDPGPPQPGDWRYEHREKPQSFDAFIRSKPNVPYPGKNTIYVLPLGDFPPEAPALEAMTKIVHAYFTLDVKLMPAVPIDSVVAKRRINGGTKKRQLLAPDVLTWLKTRLPANAYALMAVTMEDLYPDETWNFVFGMATFEDRVGVQSFARQDPAFFGEQRTPGWEKLALRRATWTVVHEIAHMFGLHHCQYFKCVIAGSNNQDEADRAPLHACPVCMHKLWWSIEFDPAKRELELAATLRSLGLDDEAVWSEQRAKWIRGPR